MVALSVACCNGFWSTKQNISFCTGKFISLRRYNTVCYSPILLPPVLVDNFSKKQRSYPFSRRQFLSLYDVETGVRLACSHGIGSLMVGSVREREALSRRRSNRNVRRRFAFRIRPRLWFFKMRKKSVSVRSMLNDLGIFLRKNVKRVILLTSISVALGFCYLFLKLTSAPSPQIVPYSALITSLQSGSVTKVLIEEGSRHIYYKTNPQSSEFPSNLEGTSLVASVPDEKIANSVSANRVASKSPREANAATFRTLSRFQTSAPQWQFSTRKIDHDEKFLLSLMREKGASYSSAPQSVLMSMRSTLITIISLWVPLSPLMWIVYRQLSASNSPARKQFSNCHAVTFDDVEGVEAAKVELVEIVSCLRGASNYEKLGAKVPRGVLLVGPPGTGKTLLARAVAGEAEIPFFSVSASEFVELFVGRGAARIRDLFNAARKRSPSIIFIDELDAVGGRRGRSFNDERDQTLNQLLIEMDGFDTDMKVVVIAATNRPEALDPALCRPGRFSRKVLLGEPDEDGRRKILAVHFKGVPLEENTEIICDLVASLTPGFVGADLANIVNEATLLAARRGGETVTREDIMEAIERAKFGINNAQTKPKAISKELGRLFPWVPSLMRWNETKPDGWQGPLGYQTLS